MKEHGDTGVFYSNEYFTEEMVDWLLQSPRQKVLVSKEEGLPTQIETTEGNAESVFASAWAEMSQDPEFVKAVKQRNYTADQALADFNAAIAASIPNEVDKRLSSALAVDHITEIEDDEFVHYVNGERILAIPKSVDSAALVSANAEAVLYAIFIVIDVLSVVAAAASINVYVNKTRVAKSLQGPLVGFLKRFLNPTAVAELKRLQAAGDKIALILKVLAWLRGSVNLNTVVTTFLESMSYFEIVVAVLQLLASIGLLLATAGASFAAKVLQLAASIVLLVADVVAFVLAIEKK